MKTGLHLTANGKLTILVNYWFKLVLIYSQTSIKEPPLGIGFVAT